MGRECGHTGAAMGRKPVTGPQTLPVLFFIHSFHSCLGLSSWFQGQNGALCPVLGHIPAQVSPSAIRRRQRRVAVRCPGLRAVVKSCPGPSPRTRSPTITCPGWPLHGVRKSSVSAGSSPFRAVGWALYFQLQPFFTCMWQQPGLVPPPGTK